MTRMNTMTLQTFLKVDHSRCCEVYGDNRLSRYLIARRNESGEWHNEDGYDVRDYLKHDVVAVEACHDEEQTFMSVTVDTALV